MDFQTTKNIEKLHKLYSYAMKPIFEESNYSCFIDNETFKNNRGKIFIITGVKRDLIKLIGQ